MSHPTHAAQPGASAPMTSKPDGEERPGLLETTTEKFAHSAAEEAGKQVVDYQADNVENNIDDTKEQARGLWQKYCGCFGSA